MTLTTLNYRCNFRQKCIRNTCLTLEKEPNIFIVCYALQCYHVRELQSAKNLLFFVHPVVFVLGRHW